MAQNKELYPVNYEIEYRIAAITSGVLNIDKAIADLEAQYEKPTQKVDFRPIQLYQESPNMYSETKDTPKQVTNVEPTDVRSLEELAKEYALDSRTMFAGTGN